MMNPQTMARRWEKVRYTLNQASPLAKCLMDIGKTRWEEGKPLSYSTTFAAISRHVTGHEFSEDDKAYFGEYFATRKIPWWALLASFYRLPLKFETRIFRTSALERHHAARLKLIQETLPAAQVILDVGGAADSAPEGSLLLMGYPHRPKEVWIVDLPVEERIYTSPKIKPTRYETKEGTVVQYLYSSMADLSPMPNEKFDLVWSGQSIEHISEDEADRMIAEVKRVLKPGGSFCLDTPNRKVTRLLGEGFIHPEHKIEYTPSQLAQKIESAGFEIVAVKAVTPMPISVRHERFCKLEAIREYTVTDEAEVGLSFYIHARKK